MAEYAARGASRPAARGAGRGPAAGYAFGPAREPRAAAPSRARAARSDRALVLFMIAAAAVAFAALLVALVPSALRISRFEVSGSSSMTEDDVVSASLVRSGESFFSVRPDRVEAALEADPRIRSASVSKAMPNRLKIAIVERKAVATALVDLGGRAAAVKVDAEGVAFAAAAAEEASVLPVLSGLRFEGFRLGARLPAALSPLLESLARIRDEDPLLLSAFSEIRIVKQARGGPELVLYPMAARIPVRAGASLSAQTLRSMILVLDVLGTRGIAASVEELDFRSGTVVYRGKEDHSG